MNMINYKNMYSVYFVGVGSPIRIDGLLSHDPVRKAKKDSHCFAQNPTGDMIDSSKRARARQWLQQSCIKLNK